MKATVSLGRQPESPVLVFGPEVQLTTAGEVIPLDEQEYEWVLPIIERLSVLPTSHPLLTVIPQCTRPLEMLLTALKKLSQNNFVPAVFILGKLILQFVVTIITLSQSFSLPLAPCGAIDN